MKKWFTLIVFSIFWSSIIGQVDTTQLYQIHTSDGNIFIGSIVSESESEIIIKTFAYGSVPIKKYLITQREPLTPKKAAKVNKQVKNFMGVKLFNFSTKLLYTFLKIMLLGILNFLG